ncbi:MAG: F0F1 ATP synthase subunit B [Methylacidiphilales bacterium]|nr:F0F1 ATP synthase subunit B [Candidatus Methylacidiphilales bacterium]
MNINLTLIGQSISFLLFTWFCWKMVWPNFAQLLQQRQHAIEAGIKAAEQGHRTYQESQLKAEKEIALAKQKANELLQFARQNATHIEEQAKLHASQESARIITLARSEAELMREQLMNDLRGEVGELAVQIAEKIIQEKVNAKLHNKLIQDLVQQLK